MPFQHPAQDRRAVVESVSERSGGLALPGLLRHEPGQPLMRAALVVPMREPIQGRLQFARGREAQSSQCRLQGAEEALDAAIAPGLAGWPAPMGDAQRLQCRPPQRRREHGLVVGANRFGQAMDACRDEQMAQHDESAFRGQHFQAHQLARAGIEDAQHREGRPEGRANEGQIQRPGVTWRHEERLAALAFSAESMDLGIVLAHERPDRGLADRGPTAVPAVVDVGNGAAAGAVEARAQVEQFIANVRALEFGARVWRSGSMAVRCSVHDSHMPAAPQPPQQASWHQQPTSHRQLRAR